MQRGERQSEKTRKSIKTALLGLMREKNYPKIKVKEITEKADVGRSTLYKHYPSKAHILVDIHRDIFRDLLDGLSKGDIKDKLKEFLFRQKRTGRNPFQLSYKLGSDLDFLMNGIISVLTEITEEKLKKSFCKTESSISLSILASSVSSMFSGMIVSWFTKFDTVPHDQYAQIVNRNINAVIREARASLSEKT